MYKLWSRFGKTEVTIEAKDQVPLKLLMFCENWISSWQRMTFKIHYYRNFKFVWMRAVGGKQWNDAHFWLGSLYTPKPLKSSISDEGFSQKIPLKKHC